MTTRRQFLALSGAIAVQAAAADTVLSMVPPPDLFDPSLLEKSFWEQDRSLKLVRPQTNEKLEVLYWKEGVYLPSAYEQLCYLLRDVNGKEQTPMDKDLIDTLWSAQAFVRRYGFNDYMHILSGYRTPKSNEALRERGIPAARQSLHVQAKAADIRMPGLHAEVLGKLVKGFGQGGVGFYFKVNSNTGGWIHADTGRVRSWQG